MPKQYVAEGHILESTLHALITYKKPPENNTKPKQGVWFKKYVAEDHILKSTLQKPPENNKKPKQRVWFKKYVATY